MKKINFKKITILTIIPVLTFGLTACKEPEKEVKEEQIKIDIQPMNVLDVKDNVIDLGEDEDFECETDLTKIKSTKYRIPQKSMDVDLENGVIRLYKIETVEDNQISKSVVRIIREENEYIEPGDVAAYLQGFKKAPKNYNLGGFTVEQKQLYQLNARACFVYYTGEDHKRDYTPNLGPWIPKEGLPYYEYDIADKDDAERYVERTNRGLRRIVMAPGTSQYKYVNDESKPTFDNVCFYTDDHYKSFREYYNYYNGWSDVFSGWEKGHGERPESITLNNI